MSQSRNKLRSYIIIALLHGGWMVGMKNRIKVIKRMAYGYRDTEYFFLTIRAAFPGKMR